MPLAKILVVEDEAITAMDIKRTLEKLNYTVAGVADRGDIAIRLTDELKPDLILMDITLKGDFDGIECASLINKVHNIPIVYLSVHNDEETIERSKTTDPYGYLLKPLNDRDLNSCIRMSLFRHESENRLKESEKRFKALTEVALSSIIIIQGTKFVYANPYAEVLTGYKLSEMAGLNFWDIVHPDSRELVKQRGLARQRGEEVPASYEFRIITKDGSSKWVQTSATVTDFEGTISTLAIVFDITDRKNAEEILKQSEEKFRAVAESMPAQIVIFQKDRIIYANPYSVSLTGYSENELLKMNFWNLVHPEFSELVRSRVLSARSNKKNETQNYEMKIVTKGGDHRWISFSARDIEYNGKPAVLGIANDITESKRISQEIEASQQRYKAFIEQSTEGIYRTEAYNPVSVTLTVEEQVDEIFEQFYIAECNDVMAKMYGLNSASELIGKKMSDFLVPGEPVNRKLTEDFVKSGYRVVDSESMEPDTNGNIIQFSNNAVGIVENGYLKRVWGIQKDITAKKKLDKKLNENVEYSSILNYFTTSLLKQNTVDEILWDITQNCFSKLSFVDCVIYLLDETGETLLQKAAYGKKDVDGYRILKPLNLKLGEGIVGYVAKAGIAEIIPDTSVDKRYIVDETVRLSEITVPIINDGKVIGVIDSEHPLKGFFTQFHLDLLQSIASLCSIKIVQAMAQEKIRKSEERYRTFVEQSSEGIYRLEMKQSISVELALDEQVELIRKDSFIAECNDVFARMYDENSSEDMTGRNTNQLNFVNINDKESIRRFIMENYNTSEEESIEMNTEGSTRYFISNAVGVIENGNLTSIWGVKREITERKKSEEALKRSLKEKEILLKEIHHRVSLLKLQSSYVNDEKVKHLFKESQNRVQSMSLIHQKLYQTKDLAHIDFKEYIETLATHLQHSYGILEDRIRITIDVKNLHMSIDNAIPAGLIINELVSNCLKHAFPEDRTGNIIISAAFDEFSNEYWIVVRDDGIGISKDVDFRHAATFGLKLVTTLVAQMGGSLELVTMGGSEFRINFRIADYMDRN
jgi:PAS domain S-box-containing protein